MNQDLIYFYPEFNGYGYIVKKTELENLMQEVWGKLDDPSKTKLNKLRTMVDNMIEYFPVHKRVNIIGMDGEKKREVVDRENFKKLKELLIIVHSYINELLEAAGYSTFTIDGDDGDPYN